MSKKRGPYSSPRQQERRERILRAAGIQLEKLGYSALSMQSIADASDVSAKTLYNLFGNLDQLLLDAASQILDDLQQSAPVVETEAGIPRLLAFTEGTMQQFEDMPEYSRAVISILVRVDLDIDTAYERFGPVQRFAYDSLATASEKGELRPGLDLLELSYLVSANEWGAVLMWEKGLLEVGQLKRHVGLNNSLTLMPFCRGAARAYLEEKIDGLLAESAVGAPNIARISIASQ